MSNPKFNMRLPEALMAQTETAAERTNLSKHDVLLQSIRLGLPLLEQALSLTGPQLVAMSSPANANAVPESSAPALSA